MNIPIRFFVSFLENFHRYRQDIGTLVSHDIRITQDMNHILKVSFCYV